MARDTSDGIAHSAVPDQIQRGAEYRIQALRSDSYMYCTATPPI